MARCRKPMDLQNILVRRLDRKVPAEGRGQKKCISRREALLRTLVDKAEEGDVPTLRLLFEFYRKNWDRPRTLWSTRRF